MNNLKIRKVKKILKKQNKYFEYKKNFLNKSSFFFLTKVSIIFNSTISLNELSDLEFNLSQDVNNPKNWEDFFEKASIYFQTPYNQCDWKSFGFFMYFAWSKLTFNKNIKKNKSIYTFNNFNQINAEKMTFYNKWINSMIETNDKNFNLYVRKVLKEI